MDQTYLSQLSRFYVEKGKHCMTPEVINKARRVLVDFLSEVAVGFQTGTFQSQCASYLHHIGGAREATILCHGNQVPAMHAALALGVLGHSIELDDGHRWGTCHPAVAIIPAVLAMSERDNASFTKLLEAIIIGYDVMLRAARAINPSHLKRGFHSTGTCGALGAAAACAYLKNFDAQRFAYSVSLGGLQSAGLQEMLHDHPGIKPLQPGKAALGGVLAADLVDRGAKGPRTLFEGEHGWLKAMCNNEFSEEALLGALGKRWEIMYTYTKLYPTCRHCHAAVDLAREGKKRLGLSVEDVKSIHVKTYALGIAEVGKIFVPHTFEEAMFSLPFSVAIALERGNVTLQDYDAKTLADPVLRETALKVRIEEDEEMNRIYPEERGAWINITLHDGRQFEKGIPVAKGEPENPVTDEDLVEKLAGMVGPYYPQEFFNGLWELCVKKPQDEVSYGEIVNHFGRFHS
ncbi:MmgE/PrpD family protein [Aminobacterium sp. UBA5277]|uniref:MmgE/PrpD family protein n=1 Tax=Aminobacterium sp. UBA5277 TaxID=1946029 RepID=UPI002581191D|nr:MmgE/PrpD family protein [Aminobacterium sp. UBA5277]